MSNLSGIPSKYYDPLPEGTEYTPNTLIKSLEGRFGTKNSRIIRIYYPETGFWYDSRRFVAELRSRDLTPQDWYDKYILHIDSPEDRPKCKCPECTNKSLFRNILVGYTEFCSKRCANIVHHNDPVIESKRLSSLMKTLEEKGPITRSEESCKRMSESATRRWSNPEERQKQSERTTNFAKTEYGHQVRSDAAKLAMSNPETIKKKSESAKISMNIPEVKEKALRSLFGSDGLYLRTNYKSGYHLTEKSDHPVHYRSSYELAYYLKLDSDPNVMFYQSERFHIEYFYERPRFYFPDVLEVHCDGSVHITELKNSGEVGDPLNVQKYLAGFKYAREHGMTYHLLIEWQIFDRITMKETLEVHEYYKWLESRRLLNKSINL